MRMNETQFVQLKDRLQAVSEHSPFYRKKFADCGFCPEDVKTPEDIVKIPFSSKEDLRNAYPLGLQAVPDEEIVRIHSSSGTTGLPVIIPYTRQDVDDWATMMARCMTIAGVTNRDRVQITPGYGLWTAGIGFQAGVERVGAMAVPMGPGNTEKQIQMMVDLQTTTLGATSSYALLLAEEIRKRGLKDKIALKRGIIGSERWGDKMRDRIATELDIDLYDIYGLTEIYGPGISVSCKGKKELHYFDDFVFFEVIDYETGLPVPDGEVGELVITTLKKQGAPLLRYRTRDLTRLIPGECSCGLPYPRHDRIIGRADDMTKVKGVNIYPAQIDGLLSSIQGASSEYQVVVDKIGGKDHMVLRFERENGTDADALHDLVQRQFKLKIGILIEVEALPAGALPRSEKKTVRIIDHRYQ